MTQTTIDDVDHDALQKVAPLLQQFFVAVQGHNFSGENAPLLEEAFGALPEEKRREMSAGIAVVTHVNFGSLMYAAFEGKGRQAPNYLSDAVKIFDGIIGVFKQKVSLETLAADLPEGLRHPDSIAILRKCDADSALSVCEYKAA